MAVFKCKMCGGTMEINNNETVATCDYCGVQQTLPKLDDEKRANLYDRANHFRRNNEFDKAMGIYEQILNEDKTDAESYWSLVLCRYGIEYVEDPASHKRVPTVNRAQFTSIFDDDNYKSALEYADALQKTIYEDEAKAINEIQKGILAISQMEEPFDVFICYKETDDFGRRTPDSVLANDLYHQLTQEGFKVFFARITLEDKLGSAYEPYIFAALNSAKIMVVLGTKPEYFNAVWVKNEWSRYLALVKNSNGKKMLIPAYKDMDPYDLPEEFSHLQAQDMSKLGFMQDLIRGIKKIAQSDEPKTTVVKETVVTGGNLNIETLLKRVFIFLEDKDWNSANEYCEKVLDIDPENAEAYLGKLLADLRVRKRSDLKHAAESFKRNGNYMKALRYGDITLAGELADALDYIEERNERTRLEGLYRSAVNKMNSAKTEKYYKDVAKDFEAISDYKDAKALAQECLEKAEVTRKDAILAEAEKAKSYMDIHSQETAIRLFKSVSGWENADEQILVCRKNIENIRAAAEEQKRRAEAARIEQERQAEAKRKEEERIAEEKRQAKKKKKKKTMAIMLTIVALIIAAIVAAIVWFVVILPQKNYENAIDLMNKGESYQALREFDELGNYKDSEQYFSDIMKSIDRDTTVSVGHGHIVAIKEDNTVIATGLNNDKQCDVDDWEDIVSVSAGYYHTVGLKADGTVVAVGNNDGGQCDVSEWTDIVQIAAGYHHTVGLKSDGSIVIAGFELMDGFNEWSDGYVEISAGYDDFVALDMNGNVNTGSERSYSAGYSMDENIIGVDAAVFQITCINPDGTVKTQNNSDAEAYSVSDWRDIVDVEAEYGFMVGLKSDGTVVSAGKNINGRCNVEAWSDIVAISVGDYYTVGLKSDGTLVTTGYGVADDGLDVSGWTNIKVPESKKVENQASENQTSVNQNSDKGEKNIENLKSAKVGDIVTFGSYEQDDNTGNGQEDIEWIVLEKTDGKILVVSKYALDTKKFHNSSESVTWETCSMRKWLNEDFVSRAFSEGEKEALSTVTLTNTGNATNDKVFLLSVTEAKKYFTTDEQRICAPTKSAEVRENENASWTLRSSSEGGATADYVSNDGSVKSRSVEAVMSFVRPAMWIEVK